MYNVCHVPVIIAVIFEWLYVQKFQKLKGIFENWVTKWLNNNGSYLYPCLVFDNIVFKSRTANFFEIFSIRKSLCIRYSQLLWLYGKFCSGKMTNLADRKVLTNYYLPIIPLKSALAMYAAHSPIFYPPRFFLCHSLLSVYFNFYYNIIQY